MGQAGRGIVRVSPNGGTGEVLCKARSDETLQGPQMLPGGRAVLFTVAATTGVDRWEKAKIVAQVLGSGERKVLVEGGTDARYLPTGHLVYALAGVVLAIPFDPERLQTT